MKNLLKLAVTLSGLIFCFDVSAQDLMPPAPIDPFYDSWSFDDPTNWTSDLGFAPIAYTNTINDGSCWSSDDGILNCNGLILDSTNAAFLNYKTVEDNGHTNLSCTAGTIWFWFSPDWDSESQGGTGPGDWGRFLDVGAYTTNATFGWWSLLLSPDGNNIYFSGQTNGTGTNYLNAPISWTAGSWHLIGLTYTATNSILYIDDQVATNGIGVIYPPGHDVLTNGFWIGSDFSGIEQARGEFVDFESWNIIFPVNEFSAYYDEMLPELPGGEMGGFSMDSGFGGFSSDTPSGGGSGGVPGFVDGTNLWLQITGTSNSASGLTAYFVIWPPAGVTNGVYDLFYTTNLANDVPGLSGTNWSWVLRNGAGETNLTVTNLTADSSFFRLGLTNDTDGDGLSDAFEKLVSHTDPNNADQNTNGIPDGWEWNYFGNLNQTAGGDYDGDGYNNGQEYTNHTDPDKIRFSLNFPNHYVNTNVVNGTVTIQGGVPGYYAVLVNDTNQTDAGWQPYTSSNIVAMLGSTDGTYNVSVGLRGLPADATQTWQNETLIKDTVAPVVVVTNPVSGAVDQPMMQLEGYASKSLGGLFFDVSNALGVVTGRQGFVTDQHYDTNSWKFTTNDFQCFDIALTNGLNTITLRATDLAGNTTATNLNYTLSYADRTNAPTFTLAWPQSGAQVGGNQFTAVGQLADYTATVTATLTDTNGNTNTLDGVVERDGTFWMDNVPLNGGTNTVTLTITDPAGNVSVTNIVVYQSGVVLTMNAPDAGSLWNPTINASGTISGPDDSTDDYTVWVNGVEVTNNGYGSWNGTVRVNTGGVADFNITAYPPGHNPGGGGGGGGSGGSSGGYQNPSDTNAVSYAVSFDKPCRVYVAEDVEKMDYYEHYRDTSWGTEDTNQPPFYWEENWTTNHYDIHWKDGLGGGGSSLQQEISLGYDSDYDYTNVCAEEMSWPGTNWENIGEALGTGIYSGNNCGGGTPTNVPVAIGAALSYGSYDFYAEHCYDESDPQTTSSFGYVNWWGWAYDEDDQTYTRHAQTTMKLATGGRAVPGRMSLFKISGWAKDVEAATGKRSQPPYMALTYEGGTALGSEAYLPPETLTVGALGNLDTNGDLYVLLPDGDPPLTIDAHKNFFIYGVTGQKIHLDLRSVTFTGAAHAILQDTNGVAYATPHWTNDDDGKFIWRNPTLYPSGNRVQTSTEFKVSGGGSFLVIIKGEASGGSTSFTLWATNSPGGTDWSADTVADTALATNRVDYYNPMEIKWSYAAANQPQQFLDAGTSYNKVYVSLKTPAPTTIYRTVAYLACSNPGATNENQAAANTWALFAGPANVKTWDNMPLYYYKSNITWHDAVVTTSDLLRVNNGQCTSWQALLYDAWSVNGIASTKISVSATNSMQFLVNDWTFGTPSLTSEPEFKWQFIINHDYTGDYSMVPAPDGSGNVYGSLTSLTTLPGQNTQPPSEKFFDNHQIVLYNGTYYDPSYGGIYTNEADFESKAVAGYAIRTDFGSGYDVYKVRKPNATNSIIFTPR